jgi:hypothetical protein
MSASICINLGAGTGITAYMTFSSCTLDLDQGVSVALAVTVTGITITAGSVMLESDSDGPFSGSCVMAIDWNSGDEPAVTVSGLAGATSVGTVTWPTASGPTCAVLTAGTATPLKGIVGA